MADDLVVYQGASLRAVFEVTDDADAPFPLIDNGYTAAAMQARPRVDSDVLLLDLSTAGGQLTIEPAGATGEVHIDVPADQTAAVTESGEYDCVAWNPSDTTDVIVIAPRAPLTRKRRVTAAP